MQRSNLMGRFSAENLSEAIGGQSAVEVGASHTIFRSRVLAVNPRPPATGWPQPLGGRARKFVPPVLLEVASRSGVGAWIKKYRPAGSVGGSHLGESKEPAVPPGKE